MTDNKPFDAVEHLVSLEALSAITAAVAPDDNESPGDHRPKNEIDGNQFLDPPIRPHPRDDLE